MTHRIILIAIITLIFSKNLFAETNSSFLKTDKIVRELTQNLYGLIDNNANIRILRKLELCSTTKSTIEKTSLIIKANCPNLTSPVTTTLKIGKVREVLHSDRHIHKGTEITPNNAYIYKMAVDNNYSAPPLSRRFVAKKDIKKDEPITKFNTKAIYDLVEGEVLKTESSGKGFKINRSVTILESGNVGDTILVNDGKERKGKIIIKNGQILINIL